MQLSPGDIVETIHNIRSCNATRRKGAIGIVKGLDCSNEFFKKNGWYYILFGSALGLVNVEDLRKL